LGAIGRVEGTLFVDFEVPSEGVEAADDAQAGGEGAENDDDARKGTVGAPELLHLGKLLHLLILQVLDFDAQLRDGLELQHLVGVVGLLVLENEEVFDDLVHHDHLESPYQQEQSHDEDQLFLVVERPPRELLELSSELVQLLSRHGEPLHAYQVQGLLAYSDHEETLVDEHELLNQLEDVIYLELAL